MNETKRVCLKDIAFAAKASPSTVSAALNGSSGVSEQRKMEIRDIASKMGYQVSLAAKILKTKCLNDIGLVIAEDWKGSFTNVGFYNLLGEFLKNSQEQKITTQLEWFGSYDKDGVLPSIFTNGMVGGILFAGKGNPFVENYMKEKLKLPFVRLLEEGHHSVRFDITEGMIRSMQYLAALGHQRIVLINGSARVDVFQQAKQAYRKSICDFALDSDDNLYMEQIRTVPFDQEIHRLTNRILELKPDAVIGVGGMLSSWLSAELMRRGKRVPEDISVLAFACLEWETNSALIPVTGMCADYSALINEGILMLKKLMEKNAHGKTNILVPLDMKIKNTIQNRKKRRSNS